MKHDAASRLRSLASSFPGLLGRGLIEAVGGRDDPPYPEFPSPVYWAGASLKHACGAGRRQPRVRGPSPVYWAGASLKHLGI